MNHATAETRPRTASFIAVRGMSSSVLPLIERLVGVALAGLPAMWRPERDAFAFTRRRGRDGSLELAGESLRYTAIVALGAAHLPDSAQRVLFGGEPASVWIDRALSRLSSVSNLGDAALLLWAAAALDHGGAGEALAHLRALDAEPRTPRATVEVAWVLSACAAASALSGAEALGSAAHARLLASSGAEAGLFPHAIEGRGYRSHVACFADQVYPIQALARWSRLGGGADAHALDRANRCAARICSALGPAGQWWWHWDARSGDVIEGYPVYSVHQNSMGPMALLDLREAGGADFGEAIERGLSWMEHAPEVGRSLIDEAHGVIWRKVARNDPWKLVRAGRAAATRLYRGAVPFRPIDWIFRPTHIDFECRPYHLGWILFAWAGRKRGKNE